MKKWIITGFTVLALVLAGLYVRSWLPILVPFLENHDKLIQTLSAAIQILLWGAAAIALIIRVWRPGHSVQEPPARGNVTQTAPSGGSAVTQSAHAGRDVAQARDTAQIGGVRIDAHGNVSVEGDVAGGDITKIIVQTGPPTVTALRQLPAPVTDFVGREREIESLVDSLRARDSLAICGISGMGGVGKTQLVLLVANRMRSDYPDAQLSVGLRGTDPSPRDPADALASCIRAIVGTEAKLPESLDDLTKIYLDQLAGKRALVLLDNAAGDAQVRPFVPPSGCALLITSRETITLPGMKRLALEQLLPNDASKLLASSAQRPISTSVGNEICQLCGYLPLALRAAGSLLNVTTDLDPGEYATQLRDERTRLSRIGQVGVDAGVDATLNVSYRRLPDPSARVFRQLAVFPGSFDAAAEEVVCEDPGHSHLSALLKRSSVLYEDFSRRYRLHDLVRLFADTRLELAERATAQRRHAKHFSEVIATASCLYRQGGESLKNGLALFDAEWGNIQAGQAWASGHAGEDNEAAKLCSDYPDAGVYCLALRQHPRERIRWLEAAIAAARRLQDRAAEGAHLGSLGSAYYYLGEYRRAMEYYEQRLKIARDTGNRLGEAAALGNLGVAYKNLGDYRRAIGYHERALEIERDIGDRRGVGQDLCNLGIAYYSLGEYRRAIEYHEQHLKIAREIGDRLGEGGALGSLGLAYLSLGDYRRAVEYLEQALKIEREIGDRRGEGMTLGNLGLAYGSLGEYRRAIEYDDQHLRIARETGDRRGEGNALWNMALALNKLGDRAEAISRGEAGLKILEEIEHPGVEEVRSQLDKWRHEIEGCGRPAEGTGSSLEASEEGGRHD